MARKERTRLTDAAIARLRPREREYTVWDSRAPGLGVRVRPSGGKSYVLLDETGGGSKRVTLGAVSLKTVAEARRECHIRNASPGPEAEAPPRRAVPLFREFVEGAWKEACFDRYKPSTRPSVRSMLARQLLPAFGSTPLDRIAPAQVRRWFDAYSRSAPGNANHGLMLLRQILNFAIARGYIDANPTRGLKPNRRPPLSRFLSREEVDRLYAVLDQHAGRDERRRQQADIIRLLLLTGAARERSCGSAGPKLPATCLSSRTARPVRDGCTSIPRPGAFSTGSRAPGARSCSHRRSIRPGRAAEISGSGTGFVGRPASRTAACTISVTRTPATR